MERNTASSSGPHEPATTIEQSTDPDRPAEPDQVTIRTHGLQGILATIPYLLGFHPRQSLVLVLFHGPRVILTLRLDIDRLVEHPADTQEFVVDQLGRTEATSVLAVGYTDLADPQVEHALECLAFAVESDGWDRPEAAEVLDVVHVAAGRYRSVTCRDTSCCPPEGFDYAGVLSDPAAAEAVVSGLPALADREDRRALIRPGSQTPTAPFERGLVAAMVWLGTRTPREVAVEMDRRLRQVESAGAVPAPEDLGALTAFVTNPYARDVATLRIERRSAPLWTDVWSAAARCTEGTATVGPLALVGMAAWAHGDGALVCLCLEEAEQRFPEHGLVGLLNDVVDLGLHPDEWHRMRRESLLEFGPLGPASQAGQEDGEERAVG